MLDPSFNTVTLQHCIDRWREGDTAAMNELVSRVIHRLRKLARRMTRGFPNIRSAADTDDVLQNSLMRLLRTLQQLRPRTTRDFFNLAAVHIRRELIDLARTAKRKHTVSLDPADSQDAAAPEPAAPEDVGPEADRWVRFHEAVDRLPIEEREVVGLVFYHGWTQDQIAELFGVDTRTVRRRWKAACERLRVTAGELPSATRRPDKQK